MNKNGVWTMKRRDYKKLNLFIKKIKLESWPAEKATTTRQQKNYFTVLIYTRNIPNLFIYKPSLLESGDTTFLQSVEYVYTHFLPSQWKSDRFLQCFTNSSYNSAYLIIGETDKNTSKCFTSGKIVVLRKPPNTPI